MPSPSPLTIYLAGELFSLKHLMGNAVLGESIYELSKGRFVPVIPQNLEQRETTAHAIRDQDLKTVLACDVGVFHYDGTELDSGTVVEYLYAKFADIPSVLLRTDFRSSGDQAGFPWNLMTSYFPRTEVILVDGMALYQKSSPLPSSAPPEQILREKAGAAAGKKAIDIIAQKVIDALERVIALPPVMPVPARREIYSWLAHMPAFIEKADAVQERFLQALEEKQKKGLL
jgi:nucleoside 2-deoxyribosyltransferase